MAVKYKIAENYSAVICDKLFDDWCSAMLAMIDLQYATDLNGFPFEFKVIKVSI